MGGSLAEVCLRSDLSDAEKAMCSRHGPYSETSDYSFVQEAKAAARARDPLWNLAASLTEQGVSNVEYNIQLDALTEQLRSADPGGWYRTIKQNAELAAARAELETTYGAGLVNRAIYFDPATAIDYNVAAADNPARADVGTQPQTTANAYKTLDALSSPFWGGVPGELVTPTGDEPPTGGGAGGGAAGLISGAASGGLLLVVAVLAGFWLIVSLASGTGGSK